MSDVQLVVDSLCGCGESPLWHPDHKLLYWLDVDEGKMFSYDPAKGVSEQVYEGETIGGMTLHEDGRLLLFKAAGKIELWSPDQSATLLEGIEAEKHTRFNDVIADPEGRVFCGTMPDGENPGRLYRFDPDGTLHLLLEKVGQPNGMAFSPDGKFFYFTDTKARTIIRFKYDRANGSLSQSQTLVEGGGEGNPDGLTVDEEGYLWSARWDGSRLERYDADGRLASTLELPVKNVTCATFVGSELYVTSAGGGYRPEAGEKAGSLFKANPGVAGPPEHRSRSKR